MVSGKNPTERRAHARVTHVAQAVLSTGRGEFIGDVVDVSEGGLGVNVAANIHRGEFVRVRLPLRPHDDAHWIDPDAVVVRVTERAEHRTLGLSFHGLPAPMREQLAQHVEIALQEQAPLPETPTQRFIAKPRGEDPEAERQALRDAVVGTSSAPKPNQGGSTMGGWLARVFGRRAKSETPTAPKSARSPQTSRPARDDLQGLIRASLEHVADAPPQDKATKTKKR